MVAVIEWISDRMLSIVVPKAAASAQYCRPTGQTCAFCGCYGSRASYKQWWACADGSRYCSSVCEITTV